MLKIRNLYLYLLLPLLIICLNFLLTIKVNLDKYLNTTAPVTQNVTADDTAAGETTGSDYVGEKIIYDVKLGKLTLGKARFSNMPHVRVDGRQLGFMTMETKLSQFSDTEKIYSDLETLLPIKVERDVRKLVLREKITEEYDQNNFTVTITKEKNGKDEETIIRKDSYIHNALLLPFYVRRIARLDVGRIIIANLPTRRLEVKLVSIDDIKVPAGKFRAYHFKSTPKQIEIWVSADERRIPIKIQGAGLFNYSMVMRDYAF